VINGFDRYGAISHDETDKVRIGTKLLVNPNTDLVKFVVSGGMWIPTQSKNDPAALTTSRTDWDLGASFNYKILTVGVSWLLPAPKDDNYRPPNQINFGLGFNIPFVPGVFKGVAEINRVHFDGGSTKPDDYSEVALGGRVALGKSGFTTAFAARANIDRWAKYGTSPTPFGGLIQIAYSPQPEATPQAKAPVISSEPEPAPVSVAPVRQAQAPSADGSASSVPAPATTAAVPPAPRTETSTSDEILFDPAKARLTNIAKAILDGVALRLKNNLSATCTVVGYSDPKEKGDQGKLGTQRAEASRAYLMKRHGIDASRIRVEAGGASAASSDSTRNRRAVVSVTFP
jgi:outer membrane protein OmpA-like peptidoglycan-associated protein